MTKVTVILARIVAICLFVLGVFGAVSGVWTMIGGADFGAWIFPFVIFAVELVLGNMLFGSTYDIKADKFLVLLVVCSAFLIFVRAIYGGKYLTRSAWIFDVLGKGVGAVFSSVFSYVAIAIIVVSLVATALRIALIFKNKEKSE